MWQASSQVLTPPRRTLQAYHQQWLQQPSAHGIRIVSACCLEGRVPCLLVEPSGSDGPAERGATIRRQLIGLGYQLPPYGAMDGTVVLLHGRNGRKEDLLPVAERFCAAGFRCLLPDLPAHGESPLRKVHYGLNPLESELAKGVVEELGHSHGFSQQPSHLWGMSMGGAFAVKNAANQPQFWRSMVIVSSFDRFESLFQEQVRKRTGSLGPFLAWSTERLVVARGGSPLDRIDPATWAQSVRIPVLVAHGDQDTLIRPERGQALFDGFASLEKKWLEVPGGDHNNVLVTPMPLYATMAAWFLDH